MDYLKKTIFATIWDYKQAGILDPAIDNEIYYCSIFLNQTQFKEKKKKLIKKFRISN